MPSNVYLFDPSSVSSNTEDKPLIQIMHEAELARSQEAARIIRKAAIRVASLFRTKKPDQAEVKAKPGKSTTTVPADEPRLAA